MYMYVVAKQQVCRCKRLRTITNDVMECIVGYDTAIPTGYHGDTHSGPMCRCMHPYKSA